MLMAVVVLQQTALYVHLQNAIWRFSCSQLTKPTMTRQRHPGKMPEDAAGINANIDPTIHCIIPRQQLCKPAIF